MNAAHLVRALWVLVLLLTFSGCGKAVGVDGRVVGVYDGDTITVLTPAKEQLKVRLYGVDAPELKQPFGSRAKEELSSLVFGREVRLQVSQRDRYGRIVARVYVGDTEVNVLMVQRGYAWWYRDYAKRAKELETAEREAKAARRGLWADKRAVAPWDWRRDEAANRRKRT